MISISYFFFFFVILKAYFNRGISDLPLSFSILSITVVIQALFFIKRPIYIFLFVLSILHIWLVRIGGPLKNLIIHCFICPWNSQCLILQRLHSKSVYFGSPSLPSTFLVRIKSRSARGFLYFYWYRYIYKCVLNIVYALCRFAVHNYYKITQRMCVCVCV